LRKDNEATGDGTIHNTIPKEYPDAGAVAELVNEKLMKDNNNSPPLQSDDL